MEIRGKVTLRPGREFSIRRFHPWIFSGAIQQLEDHLRDGDWVEVTDKNGHTLGFGHYQKGSITVRMLSFEREKPPASFWTEKIELALRVRKSFGLPGDRTNCYRLVHGEGDGLPGLVVDLYNGVAVMQAHSAGMQKDKNEIAFALREVLGADLSCVYFKTAIKEESREGEYLFGLAALPHLASENGNQFYIDWEAGQKTGFFLDQRENRSLVGCYAKDRQVLNTFCYTGGFSIYALNAGAACVHSVDASQKAIELTRKNIELNGFDPQTHECFAADTFEFLKDKKDQYDLIILDPPAFAKHKDAKHQAMKGYQRLNAEAIRSIRSGGIIFTFSCSQVVDRQLFYDTVVSSGIQAGREVKVLQHLSQPADHPVSLFHPEGEYLKGLILFVR